MITIGFRPTNATANTGSRPRSFAQRQTSSSSAKLASVKSAFRAQNVPATPSGTSAIVMIVKLGP